VYRSLAIAVLCAAGFLSVAAPAAAQRSTCADCHYASASGIRRGHLEEWDRSPHGRNDVGCEKCHSGDAKEFEPFLAHRGVLNPADPSSPVNRGNLPFTCGQCHIGPAVAFESSRHFELLKSGNAKGPTCSTCHGDVDGRILSPRALASACNACHGPGETAPRAERARLVREQYEDLRNVREQMKLASKRIARVDDKRRRDNLMRLLTRAEGTVGRAVEAGHKFVYDDMSAYLRLAKQHVDELLTTLANR